ncbi:MAG TPA: insulinase family protein [Candidatus Cloacimonadota bacterium]|nr:insulinase family protein [Candidatus Cloacimonadota bacterium]HPT71119.1 insulinase family protein [Candidatus Cloacimonadota bacterium]
MNLELNQVNHGFRLLWIKDVKENNSKAYFFTHEKTGAELLYMQNDDPNKVFSIFFKTPPEDSTGCPHILEHSVLNGSRKFPIKDPFAELVKGSLNTFLNAFTSSDKTMYPFASMNHKDFHNLMEVYLDSVFFPNIYKYPEIFWQEGWHREFNENGELIYKGVVYNEMKGAFSSPESALYRMVQSVQNPDNTYFFESGGDPEVIPELSYEKFINFHKNHYHPSNSRIFLYGDLDVEKAFQLIDGQYLSQFDRKEIDFAIKRQKSFDKPIVVTDKYPVSASDDTSEKTYMSMNFSLPDVTDAETCLAFAVLEHLLMDTPAAPLKKAILDAGIGKDVLALYDDGLLQPIFGVIVKYTEPEKREKFREVVLKTLTDLVRNGIDKTLIEASINTREFQLREAEMAHFPKGLYYGYIASKTWLHGADPLLYIEYEKLLEGIRKSLTEPYLERLIDKYLLKNDHSSILILEPSKTLGEERDKKDRADLDNYLAGLSQEQKEQLKAENERLVKRQMTPETPEALAVMPHLELADVDPVIKHLPLEKTSKDGFDILLHPQFANKILYMNAYFDTRVLPLEDIPYLLTLAYTIGRIDTKNMPYGQLANEINIHTGGIYGDLESYVVANTWDKVTPKLVISGKALSSKIPELFHYVTEIASGIVFENKERMLEIIREMKSSLEMTLMRAGHVIAITRLNSYYSPSGAVLDMSKGLSHYHFLSDLEANFEAKYPMLKEKLDYLKDKIFRPGNAVISLTGDDQDIKAAMDHISGLASSLPKDALPLKDYSFTEQQKNEALLTPANIQFVAQAYNFRKLGYDYSGKMLVAKSILGKDFLYNQIRVQGGAYGAMCGFGRSGVVFFCSYRDPNLKETYDVYSKLGEYMRNFNCSEKDNVKFIIGTIAEMDMPLTASMKGKKADDYYFAGITDEDRQKERTEVLNTKPSDIVELSTLVEKIIEKHFICTFGNEKKINENSELFKSLVPVFNG